MRTGGGEVEELDRALGNPRDRYLLGMLAPRRVRLRASENDVYLMPGDILGSGTVGWGSLIENNFSVHRPLEPGDVIELEIEGIGILCNTVI